MSDPNMIRAFLEQASAKGSKSTVLKPLAWMMAICIAATMSALHFLAPLWLMILFAIFAAITMVLYLVAYLYCLFHDRDALRSETYTIQKMAIEKGFVGDSQSGAFEIENKSERFIDGTDDSSEVDRQ